MSSSPISFESSGLDGLGPAAVRSSTTHSSATETLVAALKHSEADVLVFRDGRDDGLGAACPHRPARDIDVKAASARGIYVSNCLVQCLSPWRSLAVGLLLSLDRRLP